MRLPFRKCISRESGSIKTNADVNLTSLALANVRYSRQVQLQTETRSQDRKQSKKIRKLKKCIGSAADVRSHTSRNNKKLHAFRILRASLYRATTNNCRTQAGDGVIQKLVAERHKVMLRTEALQKSDNESKQGTDLQQSASLCQVSASAPLSMHPPVTN